MEAYLDSLKKSALFRDIKEEEMREILGCLTFQVRTYEHGSVIALEGNEIRYIGVVLGGNVDMIKEDLWGNHTLITRMDTGELFGETFACGVENESVVTFMATGKTVVMMLPFQRMLHTCSNACDFHGKIIRNLVQTISMKNKSLMAQAQNTQYFYIPLKRGELAQYLCADRSALIRELTQMRRENIIDFDGNTFRIY